MECRIRCIQVNIALPRSRADRDGLHQDMISSWFIDVESIFEHARLVESEVTPGKACVGGMGRDELEAVDERYEAAPCIFLRRFFNSHPSHNTGPG
jgi:hypothetical protein